MKKSSLLIILGFCSLSFLSQSAVSQEKPFIVFEYMHVKPGSDNAYMQVENFWRHIHIAQQKKGNILSWSVWQVVAPYDMNAPYQYVVITVYGHFSNYLHPYQNIDTHQIFPDASEDSLKKMFSLTGTTRDLVKSDIFQVEDDFNNGKDTKYIMAGYLKVTPEKRNDFQSFMKDHWEPLVQKTLKGNFENRWWYGSLMFSKGINAPYNRIICVQWDRDDMFDKEPPFDQYQKEDPAAFEGYKWAKRDHTDLLYKVLSLESPAGK